MRTELGASAQRRRARRQAIASIAPMAMLFVPSVDGISHARAEYSTPEDCANGAQALMELLLMADQQA